MKKNLAEFLGTFWLVLGGCGSALLAAGFPNVGIGLVGVSFAFGLTVLTIAYSLGHISGAHLNPAVTLGLFAGGVALAAGILGGWAVSRYVMETEFRIIWPSALMIVSGGVLATVLSGLGFALGALGARPAQVLRARE